MGKATESVQKKTSSRDKALFQKRPTFPTLSSPARSQWGEVEEKRGGGGRNNTSLRKRPRLDEKKASGVLANEYIVFYFGTRANKGTPLLDGGMVATRPKN